MDKIIETLFREKKSYEQATSENRGVLAEIYKAYQGKMDEVQQVPYDTKETVPKLRTEIAFVKPFIFSGQPEIEVEGVGDEDKEEAIILEKIVNYRLTQSIPDAYGKIEDWVHQAVTFGTSIIKVCWKFTTKKNEDGTETPDKDEPILEVPNIMDCFYNPMISDIENQQSLIFRRVVSIDQIKSNPAYNFTDELGNRNADKVEGKAKFSVNDYDSNQQFDTHALSNQENMVEIYERVTNDRIQTIADDKEQLVLRDVENPYGEINAVKFIFEKNTIPNVFDGLGVGHNTLDIGKSYFKMWNQTLTNVKLTNNPMSIGDKNAGIDKRQLVSKPGGHVEVDTKGRPISETFQWLQFPDIKQGAIQLLNKIDEEHKRASGANDLIQGAASNDTLGQDQIAQANISNRFELVQRRFKHALAEVAKMLIKMEIQNIQSPDAPILRIFPMEYRETVYQFLINDAANLEYNIKIKGDTIIARNKELESKRLVDLFDLSQNFLSDQEKRAFVRRIAERQGESNIDEIIMEANPLANQMEMNNVGMAPQGMNQPVDGQVGMNQQL